MAVFRQISEHYAVQIIELNRVSPSANYATSEVEQVIEFAPGAGDDLDSEWGDTIFRAFLVS